MGPVGVIGNAIFGIPAPTAPGVSNVSGNPASPVPAAFVTVPSVPKFVGADAREVFPPVIAVGPNPPSANGPFIVQPLH